MYFSRPPCYLFLIDKQKALSLRDNDQALAFTKHTATNNLFIWRHYE